MKGAFIVLDGADGTGKSSLVPRVAARIREAGLTAVETREPGGTPMGQQLRAILLGDDALSDRTEALLMAADRAEHVAARIRPAVESGAVVVSDRFLPSSLVYQGVARGLGVDGIAAINAFGLGGFEPDVVVVLDVDDATADARRAGELDRFEREDAAFHRAVRQAYRDLARRFGWTVVDAAPGLDVVERSVWAAVEPALPPRSSP